MKLVTTAVYNWPEFQWTQGVRFDCPCVGERASHLGCLECNGAGMVFPVNPTAYDTGYKVSGPLNRLPYNCVVAFEYNGTIWLGTRLREEVDPAPFLAAAWLNLFPKCQWLPEQFGDVNSIPDYQKHLPADVAAAVIAKLRESIKLNLEKSQADLDRLKQMGLHQS
jgi:hypothetical protein